jgi:hypothetical protein
LALPAEEGKISRKDAYSSAVSASKMLDPSQAFTALGETRFGGLRGNNRMLKGGTILHYWKRSWNFGK